MEYSQKIGRAKDLTLMLGLNETTDQLAMANSVRCYDHVLMREDGHVSRRALDFEGDGSMEEMEAVEGKEEGG